MRARDLVDILDPLGVRLESVGRQTDKLDVALSKLRLELGKGAELSGADGSEVVRVREKNDPRVANVLMEFNLTLGGGGLEVGGYEGLAHSKSTQANKRRHTGRAETETGSFSRHFSG